MEAEFAILGAGAIGSIIGAHLARAGHAVVMLARAQRADEIRRSGVRIRGLVDFSQPVVVVSDSSQLRAARVLIVATKTYATAAALAQLRGAAIESALSIQNGLMKNDQLAQAFGRDSVLGCQANLSGELLASGDVLFTRNASVYVGELAGVTRAQAQPIAPEPSARARYVAQALDSSGVHSAAVTDIERIEMSKFSAWAGLMVLSITTRRFTWEYLTDPGSALVLARLVREIGTLAGARQTGLSDDSVLPVATICRGSESQAVAAIQTVGHEMQVNAPKHRMSTLQDLDAGRALEVEETLGYALQLAQQAQLSLPLLNSFYPLAAAINRMGVRPA